MRGIYLQIMAVIACVVVSSNGGGKRVLQGIIPTEPGCVAKVEIENEESQEIDLRKLSHKL